MTFEVFKKTLNEQDPPNDWSDLLKSMWYDGKGDWETSHNIAQDVPTREGDWLHAYLHRKEGDQWNAEYWYRRAGRPVPDSSLEEEWESIVRYLLEAS